MSIFNRPTFEVRSDKTEVSVWEGGQGTITTSTLKVTTLKDRKTYTERVSRNPL